MAEIIRAFTEMWDRLGSVAVTVFVVISAAAYVVKWNRVLVDQLVEINRVTAKLSDDTISRNTVSMNNNTESNLKVVASVDKLVDAFGSDPMNLCKIHEIKEAIRRTGVDMTDDELAIVLKNRLRQQKTTQNRGGDL